MQINANLALILCALTAAVTPAIAAPALSEDAASLALEARSDKDNVNGNGLAGGILDGFFGNNGGNNNNGGRGGKGGSGGGRHFKQKDHAEAKQHAAELNAAKAAAATHAATKFDIDAARTNAHHKDADVKKQKDKKLNIHKGGNKKGSKGGDFGFDRRSLAGEGFGSDSGGVGKGAFGGFNTFGVGVGVGSGKGVDLGFNDFGAGSGKGGDFGFNNFGGRKSGSGGGLFYRRSVALFGDSKAGKGGKGGNGGNGGYGKGGGYDKNVKKHKQVYKHVDKANKDKEAAHIDSAAEYDAAAAQKAAHKAKAEAKAEAKHKLKKGSGKGGNFI
ncbi:hypothetical protein OC842_007255 [Tilletia horrida]|uniref:Uncharacterized protein n=1 Tax=Tilletia horrida TaxID=155126 RepID=A0AAN6G717_9BASI|nr:hypothetical protein OC842_007255 [Tilletia horrida]